MIIIIIHYFDKNNDSFNITIMEKSRVSVFVDGANFFFMQKDDLKWFADPKKILDYIESQYGKIEDAFYYIGQDAPPEAKQAKFLNSLPNMGYSVVSKPIKTIIDHTTGKTKKKANLDIEIVIDMFNTIDKYDTAVLISGDGDFERVLDLLKSKGKKVIVIASHRFIAKELRQFAGRHYIEFRTIRKQVERVPNP